MRRDVYLLALRTLYAFYALLLAVSLIAAGGLRQLWALPIVAAIVYAMYLRDKRELRRRRA